MGISLSVQSLAAAQLNTPSLYAGLLHILANPNLALILILAGTFLIYVECNRPGYVVPICCGTLAVMLGIYGLAQPNIRPLRPLIAFIVGALFTIVTLPLACIALRARHNKRIVPNPAPNLQPSTRPLAE